VIIVKLIPRQPSSSATGASISSRGAAPAGDRRRRSGSPGGRSPPSSPGREGFNAATGRSSTPPRLARENRPPVGPTPACRGASPTGDPREVQRRVGLARAPPRWRGPAVLTLVSPELFSRALSVYSLLYEPRDGDPRPRARVERILIAELRTSPRARVVSFDERARNDAADSAESRRRLGAACRGPAV